MCNRQIELPLQPAPTAVPLTEKNLSLHQYGFDVLLRKSADITRFYVGVDSLGLPSLGDRASHVSKLCIRVNGHSICIHNENVDN